jgi:hypothetical protein
VCQGYIVFVEQPFEKFVPSAPFACAELSCIIIPLTDWPNRARENRQMKISKQDEAKIIANQLALVGSPRYLTLYAFTIQAGENEQVFTSKVAAAGHEEAERLLRRQYDVRRVHKIESLGPVSAPAQA